jgi:hypothetical protein
MKIHAALAVAVAVVFATPAPAAACGASLFDRTETSVVRVWRAPNPAHVVVYVDDTAAARQLGDPQAFERALERSGHEVTVVRTPPELGAALGAQPVDVVIADAAVIDSLTADARAQGSDAAMLPIVGDAAGGLVEALEGYARTLAHDADLREALRAINDLVKPRRNG